MDGADFEIETSTDGAVNAPKLLRLKRSRARRPVGYLCLRFDMDRCNLAQPWILTRNYHIAVFGIKGHEIWKGDGYEAGVAKLAETVYAERLASIEEFQATVRHLERCAKMEAEGTGRPPAGFRAGWAKAKLPKARSLEALNRIHWTRNLEALRTRLEETGWPTNPLSALTLPTPT